MLRADQILEFHLGIDDLWPIADDARAASIGGKSHIRSAKDRRDKLKEDQLTGLIGNYCLSLWWSGSGKPYREMRDEQNLNPFKGDGGRDLPNCQIDVKTSMMRGSKDPLNYRLFVREKERHKGNTYVLALIDSDSLEGMKELLRSGQLIRVFLIGWIAEKNLPHVMSMNRVYQVQAKELLPMIPLPFVRAA